MQLGSCPGGFGIEIDAVVGGKGEPRGLGQSPGSASDCTRAGELVTWIEVSMTVITDRNYDTKAIPVQVADAGSSAVIPSKSSRTEQWPLHDQARASRNLLERFFGLVKELRGVAAQSDKRAPSILPDVVLVATRYPLENLANAGIWVYAPGRGSHVSCASGRVQEAADMASNNAQTSCYWCSSATSPSRPVT